MHYTVDRKEGGTVFISHRKGKTPARGLWWAVADTAFHPVTAASRKEVITKADSLWGPLDMNSLKQHKDRRNGK